MGIEDLEDEDEPFSERMTRLTNKLTEQFQESARIENEIKQLIKDWGYEP